METEINHIFCLLQAKLLGKQIMVQESDTVEVTFVLGTKAQNINYQVLLSSEL